MSSMARCSASGLNRQANSVESAVLPLWPPRCPRPSGTTSRSSAGTVPWLTRLVSGMSPAGCRRLFFLLAPLMFRNRGGGWTERWLSFLRSTNSPVVVDEGESAAVLRLRGERGCCGNQRRQQQCGCQRQEPPQPESLSHRRPVHLPAFCRDPVSRSGNAKECERSNAGKRPPVSPSPTSPSLIAPRAHTGAFKAFSFRPIP